MWKLRCQPLSRCHAFLNMRAMCIWSQWLFFAMAPRVAIETGGDNVLRSVNAALGPSTQMLGSTPQHLLHSPRAADFWQFMIHCRIPHWKTAIVTLAPLRMHLGQADSLYFSHNTGSPFGFIRSECAAPGTDAPRREAYARARPDFRGSAVRTTASESFTLPI